jgi:predicted ATPase
MGISLACAADLVQGRAHFDRAMALYDPAAHRPLATRFGVDAAVSALSYRSWALWFLGYPEAALGDTDQAINSARNIGQAATLMYALGHAPFTYLQCGNHAKAKAVIDEILTLADEKSALFWRAIGMASEGWLFAMTGKASDSVLVFTSGIAGLRSMGAGFWMPLYLSRLAAAYATLDQFGDARRCLDEAMAAVDTTKERWCEAEAHRIVGEIELMPSNPDLSKAEECFERALAVARQQQAKSWELRAAMSMARLWRDQGKRQHAHDLLAPVYAWFTEGFDTLDLKQAKALLEELGPATS